MYFYNVAILNIGRQYYKAVSINIIYCLSIDITADAKPIISIGWNNKINNSGIL